MRYVIDIPKNLMIKIRSILEKGDYESLNELIITALENQATLEEGEVITEDLFTTTWKMPKTGLEATQHREEKELSDIENWIMLKDNYSLKTLPMPTSEKLAYKDPGYDYDKSWLWGQINRIFSIKLGLRVLANMQHENSDLVLLSGFKSKASDVARTFGLILKKIDGKLKRGRDDRVSVGFPIGQNKEISEQRYQAHFLASIRSDYILDGAMARLKFVDIEETNDRKYLIGLTKEGLEFAKFISPILDNNINSERTLSDDEIDFYLNHIEKNVRQELNPIFHLLDIINNGSFSINEIDNGIKQIKPSWKDTFVTTYRSGALGRINELKLVRKSKNGVMVRYNISDKGKNFLERVKKAEIFMT